MSDEELLAYANQKISEYDLDKEEVHQDLIAIGTGEQKAAEISELVFSKHESATTNNGGMRDILVGSLVMVAGFLISMVGYSYSELTQKGSYYVFGAAMLFGLFKIVFGFVKSIRK